MTQLFKHFNLSPERTTGVNDVINQNYINIVQYFTLNHLAKPVFFS